MKIYNEKGSDYVFSPYSVVFKAFFTKFAMSYSAEKRRVEYEFEFTEDEEGVVQKHRTRAMCAYITDQWVEDGVKLYNAVFLGTYKVIPESWIKHYSKARYA